MPSELSLLPAPVPSLHSLLPAPVPSLHSLLPAPVPPELFLLPAPVPSLPILFPAPMPPELSLLQAPVLSLPSLQFLCHPYPPFPALVPPLPSSFLLLCHQNSSFFQPQELVHVLVCAQTLPPSSSCAFFTPTLSCSILPELTLLPVPVPSLPSLFPAPMPPELSHLPDLLPSLPSFLPASMPPELTLVPAPVPSLPSLFPAPMPPELSLLPAPLPSLLSLFPAPLHQNSPSFQLLCHLYLSSSSSCAILTVIKWLII
ncbi:hypothetical protein XELAEV_18043906mg [Xenopus laevis]|uniref:Uncharacterized protein n=1 Tax=Xenopus laevis TaxID=8355 RepID=A0A974BXR4_XENLA|nr:hypothetical protein XELAEV_18043906mg [Xenopus laevis]